MAQQPQDQLQISEAGTVNSLQRTSFLSGGVSLEFSEFGIASQVAELMTRVAEYNKMLDQERITPDALPCKRFLMPAC